MQKNVDLVQNNPIELKL